MSVWKCSECSRPCILDMVDAQQHQGPDLCIDGAAGDAEWVKQEAPKATVYVPEMPFHARCDMPWHSEPLGLHIKYTSDLWTVTKEKLNQIDLNQLAEDSLKHARYNRSCSFTAYGFKPERDRCGYCTWASGSHSGTEAHMKEYAEVSEKENPYLLFFWVTIKNNIISLREFYNHESESGIVAQWTIESDKLTRITNANSNKESIMSNTIESTKEALETCNSKIATYQKKLAYIKDNPNDARINDIDIDYEFDVANAEMCAQAKGTFKGDLQVLKIIFEAIMLPLQEQAKEHEAKLAQLKAQLSKEVSALTEGMDI